MTATQDQLLDKEFYMQVCDAFMLCRNHGGIYSRILVYIMLPDEAHSLNALKCTSENILQDSVFDGQ